MIENAGVPAHLVMTMLARGEEVAAKASRRAHEHAQSRMTLRQALWNGLSVEPDQPGLKFVSQEQLNSVSVPVLSAVDGAMVVDSKGIGDLCTAVAISLGPTEETSESLVFMDQVNRSTLNRELTTGIMAALEIEVASRAFGDVVLMDGAIIAGLINISKAIFQVGVFKNTTNPLILRAREISTRAFRDQVYAVLESRRHISVPKYVTKNEFASFVPEQYRELDGRSIASLALLPGERTQFMKVSRSSVSDADRNLIGNSLGFSLSEQQDFAHLLQGIHSCYYKPHPWTPAFRIDIPNFSSMNEDDVNRILRGISDATSAGGMQEPLPQYLVDQFAKQISVGASAVVEMSALSSINDPETQMLMAMGYRT